MDEKQKKQQLLTALYEPYKKCAMCPLALLGRTNVVFGEGNPDAKLMIIGEAPGKDEDEQGRPFIGRSGKLLTCVLTILGIQRDQIFITNIAKCRPPGNRKPLASESATCKDLLLLKQIQIIAPRVICTLGASAAQGLLGREVKVTKEHGEPVSFLDTILVPAYHPAYILRNPKELDALTRDIEKAAKLAGLLQK